MSIIDEQEYDIILLFLNDNDKEVMHTFLSIHFFLELK